jgi:hypothetical protein
MIEIFKTDVNDPRYADILVEHIQRTFRGYEVNFDLQDCDKILRVKCPSGVVDANCLINMLGSFGFHAEVLNDGFLTPGGLFLIDLRHQSILN